MALDYAGEMARYSAARCQADRQRSFAIQLRQDLSEHARWAHKLVRDPGPKVPCDFDRLNHLNQQGDKWTQVWRGSYTAPPSLPRVTRPLPDAAFLSPEEYDGLSLASFRLCAHKYPEKNPLALIGGNLFSYLCFPIFFCSSCSSGFVFVSIICIGLVPSVLI